MLLFQANGGKANQLAKHFTRFLFGGKKRSWECPPKRTKCADGRQCVAVAHICNGKQDCDDGSDETQLEIRPGTLEWKNSIPTGLFSLRAQQIQL